MSDELKNMLQRVKQICDAVRYASWGDIEIVGETDDKEHGTIYLAVSQENESYSLGWQMSPKTDRSDFSMEEEEFAMDNYIGGFHEDGEPSREYFESGYGVALHLLQMVASGELREYEPVENNG